MNMLSLVDRVIEFLKQNPDQPFTAREIAFALFQLYPDYCQQKRQNSQQYFHSDRELIGQIVAEISSIKNRIVRKNDRIRVQDQPRPRTFSYKNGRDEKGLEKAGINSETEIEGKIVLALPPKRKGQEEKGLRLAYSQRAYTEADLYPLLMTYMKKEHQVSCIRIDEKSSKKSAGKGANHWLHPDLVAIQPIAEQWNSLIKECVQAEGGKIAYLWSFEVKKQITRSTVRENFFQAVSNSSWANYGYLVCAGIADDGSMEELRILSALHGIGVLVLNVEDVMESEIVIPALFRGEVDWSSVNRLVETNSGMKNFITEVKAYYKSGHFSMKG